jgi:uncharacterized membrane protein YhaH (DUF805 family)
MDFDLNKAIQHFQAVVTKHYTDFRGRVSRHDFWTYILVYVALAVIVAIVQRPVGVRLVPLLHIALLLPTAAIIVRRLHDTGKNGSLVWLLIGPMLISNGIAFQAGVAVASGGTLLLPVLLLLSLISLVAGICLIYLCVQPGTPGPNAYGPQPTRAG